MDTVNINRASFFWALHSLCNLHRKPYSLALAEQQITAPFRLAGFVQAAERLGLAIRIQKLKPKHLHRQNGYPFAVLLQPDVNGDGKEQAEQSIAVVLQADKDRIVLIDCDNETPRIIARDDFEKVFQGGVLFIAPILAAGEDGDAQELERERRRFGFGWFVPELLRHRRLWHEILLASLVIQLIALATPLFTQAIIDKVVVHRTESTLHVVILGMGLFMLFSAALSWMRQYLVLHTGNRIDAVLGRAVFDRLFKLPPAYFQHRPTGAIAARMNGVETVREFISSAAVTLVLDLPFLLIFVAVMLYYSVNLTLLVIGILVVIAIASLVVAPAFQRRLQEQFQLGARNQAFLTEYVVGLETVKSLQLEPGLTSKYSGFLGSYLSASFATRQLSNSYHTFANLLEQMMTLMVLGVGAYTVMHSSEFTIGMLVAFQMFAGRLSQPVLRLVGLWQQFQQASLSVARLGDLMNAPVEPYSLVPSRALQRRGEIRIDDVAFRYGEHAPLVY